MDNKEKKKTKIINIILAILAVGIFSYQIFFDKKENKEKNTDIDTETISIVTNQNDFYTVSSCVSKYLNYLSIKDDEKILLLLSSEYKNKNEVNSDNLDNYINFLEGQYTFNPSKMYYQKLSKGIDKFYVYGLIQKESMYNEPSIDYYIIVILDRSKLTFAIEPYDGDIFKEE